MKTMKLSLVSIMALGSLVYAGGDISPVVEEPVVTGNNSAIYVGLGYGYFNQSNDNIDLPSGLVDIEFEVDSLLFQLGYQYNEYVALEGRYWAGLGKINQDGGYNPGDHTGTFDAWGFYVKPMYPVTDEFDVYALLGYGDTSIEYNNGAFWDTDGFSWGLGAQYAVTENILLFADYLNLGMPDSFDYTDENGIVTPNVSADINLYTINVGVSYKF